MRILMVHTKIILVTFAVFPRIILRLGGWWYHHNQLPLSERVITLLHTMRLSSNVWWHIEHISLTREYFPRSQTFFSNQLKSDRTDFKVKVKLALMRQTNSYWQTIHFRIYCYFKLRKRLYIYSSSFEKWTTFYTRREKITLLTKKDWADIS